MDRPVRGFAHCEQVETLRYYLARVLKGMCWKAIVIPRAGSSPSDDAKCEVTLAVIPVSLRRFDYYARSRCHSYIAALRLEIAALFQSLHDGRLMSRKCGSSKPTYRCQTLRTLTVPRGTDDERKKSLSAWRRKKRRARGGLLSHSLPRNI